MTSTRTFANFLLSHTFLILFCTVSGQDSVRIRQGRLQGSLVTSVSSETKYHAFKGIPYAEAPVKHLRFQPPKPHSGWEGTLEATTFGSVCPQVDDMIEETPRGEEDCLFLNVYTPKLKKELGEDEPMSVMFWIHGGYFKHGSGSSSFYNPDYFMDDGVVVVTINYRLGVLGFLDLEDDKVSGNMGMKDIVLALKWVQKNIEHFGGDPKKVTIFGNGAGAVAVDLLLLSETTKGLFNGAICQSGSSLIGSYLDWKPKERAATLAQKLGESSPKSKYILEKLMKADPYDLVTNLSRTIDVDETKFRQIGIIPFSPSIDKNSNHPFMPKYPEELFESCTIPNTEVSLMMGFNSQEAIYHSQYFVKRVDFLRQITKRFQYLFPLRGLYAKFDSDYYHELAYRIRQFYFTNGTLEVYTDTSMDEFLTFTSDLTVYPVDRAIREYVKALDAPVYYYRFTYEGGLNYFKQVATKPLFKGEEPIEVDGASEMDEICYLFKCGKLKSKYKQLHNTSEDEEMPDDLKTIKKMVRLWTNFAKYGNPTPVDDDVLEGLVWDPAVEHWNNFLDIGKNLTVAFGPSLKSNNFWDAVYGYYSPLATDGVLIDPPVKKEPIKEKDDTKGSTTEETGETKNDSVKNDVVKDDPVKDDNVNGGPVEDGFSEENSDKKDSINEEPAPQEDLGKDEL